MSDGINDPLDGMLRAARPFRNDEYLRPGEDLTADALLRRITTTVPVRRWRWRRITFFTTVTCVLVGAGVTAAVLRSRPPDDPTVIGCYSPEVLEGEGEIVQVNGDADRTAIEVCRVLWTDGTFGTEVAPELTACVSDDGVTVVVPGDDTVCAANDMDLAELGAGATADPATELLRMVSDRFDQRCLGPTEAVDVVQQIYDELNIDWKIDDSRSVDGCNTTALEVPSKTVAIVARP